MQGSVSNILLAGANWPHAHRYGRQGAKVPPAGGNQYSRAGRFELPWGKPWIINRSAAARVWGSEL